MAAARDLFSSPKATQAKAIPSEHPESHNFLGLKDGEVEQISQEAVRDALAQKQVMGLPITVWNDGEPWDRSQ
jgi:hypothetical protein